MTYATETHNRSYTAGIMDRVRAFFRDVSAFNAQYRTYNETVRELGRLSNRELADLGLSRSMITDIAREAAFGK